MKNKIMKYIKTGDIRSLRNSTEPLDDPDEDDDIYELYTPLMLACRLGKYEIAKFLLERGASVEKESAFDGFPLHIAVLGKNFNIVKMLVEEFGENVDQVIRCYKETPLFTAVSSGNLVITKYLIEKGAKVTHLNYKGVSCLHIACRDDNEQMVKLLLANGGQQIINERTKEENKTTPLLIACEKGSIKIVNLLLEYFAPVDIVNYEGQTPLHIAAKNGNFEIVKLLLSNNADKNKKDINDKTPYEIAKTTEIKKYISSFSKKNTILFKKLQKQTFIIEKYLFGDDGILGKYKNGELPEKILQLVMDCIYFRKVEFELDVGQMSTFNNTTNNNNSLTNTNTTITTKGITKNSYENRFQQYIIDIGVKVFVLECKPALKLLIKYFNLKPFDLNRKDNDKVNINLHHNLFDYCLNIYKNLDKKRLEVVYSKVRYKYEITTNTTMKDMLDFARNVISERLSKSAYITYEKEGKTIIVKDDRDFRLMIDYFFKMETTPTIEIISEETLGKGTFGTVYLTTGEGEDKTQQFLAVKVIDITNIPKSKIEQEINIIEKLNHPHIIKYLNTRCSQNKFYLTMQFMPGGSLSSLIQKITMSNKLKYPKLSYFLIQQYLKQILEALVYLHGKNDEGRTIVHRDIKSSNILLKDYNNVVLCDFGESLLINTDPNSTIKNIEKEDFGRTVGTIDFMAVEILKKSSVYKYAPYCDIWSLGCTICEWVSGCNPWHNNAEWKKITDLNEKIKYMKDNAGALENYIPNCCDELKELIRKCLRVSPLSRPKAIDLLKEPFLTKSKFEENAAEKSFILEEICNTLYNATCKQQQNSGVTGGSSTGGEPLTIDQSHDYESFSSLSSFTLFDTSSASNGGDEQEEEFNSQVRHHQSWIDEFSFTE
ncbi:hypothetical protein ABK040_009753 [Willaertia magna]